MFSPITLFMVRGAHTKLPSPAAVASAVPETFAPATPVAFNEKGKTVEEHRACVTEHIKDNREDLDNALLMTAAVAYSAFGSCKHS